MELVRGQNFPMLADKVLIHYDELGCDPMDIKDGDIIYCDTHQIYKFRDELIQHHDLIIITHNSDGELYDSGRLREFDVDIDDFGGCYRWWFGQNSRSKRSNVIPIPIGFENSRWDHSGIKSKTFNSMDITNPPTKGVYLNFRRSTNTIKRNECYDQCSVMDFVTVDQSNRSFPDYMNHMNTHRFVLCPDGNGMDCHRTWEALFVGRVPIIINPDLKRLYGDLPVLFINNWIDLFDIDLDSRYNDIINSMDRRIISQEYWSSIVRGSK